MEYFILWFLSMISLSVAINDLEHKKNIATSPEECRLIEVFERRLALLRTYYKAKGTPQYDTLPDFEMKQLVERIDKDRDYIPVNDIRKDLKTMFELSDSEVAREEIDEDLQEFERSLKVYAISDNIDNTSGSYCKGYSYPSRGSYSSGGSSRRYIVIPIGLIGFVGAIIGSICCYVCKERIAGNEEQENDVTEV